MIAKGPTKKAEKKAAQGDVSSKLIPPIIRADLFERVLYPPQFGHLVCVFIFYSLN